MDFNRIAVYGHLGWASAAIVGALANSGAPLRVLHQPTSDISMLPANIATSSIDIDDEFSVAESLKDIDIVISLAGHKEIARQNVLIRAIPKTGVKLFVPSPMSHELDEQGLRLPLKKLRREVEEAAKSAGIAMTLVRPGYLVEMSIRTPVLGVYYAGNRLIFSGDSQNQHLPLCTLKYFAAAYASLFASKPISELAGRRIGISELSPTGQDIAQALEAKYGEKPEIFHHDLHKIDRKIDLALDKRSPAAGMWYSRRLWGAGKLNQLVGNDIWTVPEYKKKSLDELVVQDKMEAYRDLPPRFIAGLLATFEKEAAS